MKSVAQAKLKRNRAVELLARGCSYEQIAKEVGFTHRGSAHRAVAKALREQQVEEVQTLRTLECERLDTLLKAHWPAAIAGDVAATEVILKIMRARISLLCLDKMHPNERAQRQPQMLVLNP